MMQLWSEDHFSGFEGKYYNYPAFYGPYLAIPKPYQKPYPPMLLPVDSQESFVPMGEKGYRIAIGAGSSPHNPRGSTVLKEDVRAYRKAWMDAGTLEIPPPWSVYARWWPTPKRKLRAGPKP
jgi:alkanesulfonate monooxygenase SsuD/methylene tetrahydromethanopterin reductase-like flavin-dependent oxidoreductase (luciferase family)